MPAVARHEARERALSLLYEAESKGEEPVAVLSDLPVRPDAFTIAIVEGVGGAQVEVDRLITEHSIGWAMDRMPVIDRVVLRIGTFELISMPGTPTAVVISEAVELASEYSTDESGRFVNGVLAKIAEVTRPASASQLAVPPKPV